MELQAPFASLTNAAAELFSNSRHIDLVTSFLLLVILQHFPLAIIHSYSKNCVCSAAVYYRNFKSEKKRGWKYTQQREERDCRGTFDRRAHTCVKSCSFQRGNMTREIAFPGIKLPGIREYGKNSKPQGMSYRSVLDAQSYEIQASLYFPCVCVRVWNIWAKLLASMLLSHGSGSRNN